MIDETDEVTLKESSFVPYGDFFNFVACALLVALSIIVNADPDESVFTLSALSFAISNWNYLFHAFRLLDQSPILSQ